MMRVIEKYRAVVLLHGYDDFWEICHPGLVEIRDNAEITCPIQEYIKNGNNRYEFVNEKGAHMNLKEFTQLFKGHLVIIKSKFQPTKASIEHAILISGFSIEKVKICHICSEKQSRKTCGDHYSKDGSRDNQVITGMRCRDSKIDAPIWEAVKTYDPGDKVQYNRVIFKANAHTKKKPIETDSSTWDRVYPNFVYHTKNGDAYNEGDIVLWKGGYVKSISDKNSTVPFAPGSAWIRYVAHQTPYMSRLEAIAQSQEQQPQEPQAKKTKYEECKEPSIEEEEAADAMEEY